MQHGYKPGTQRRARSVVAVAVASMLLFTCLLRLLPHALSILFVGIAALFPSGRQYLETFGGYSGYLQGNLLPRLWDDLVSPRTWQGSWLWLALGIGIYLVQHYTWGKTALQTRWFWGVIVAFALWHLLTYPVWAEPFYGTLETLLLIVGIALIWRLAKHLLTVEREVRR